MRWGGGEVIAIEPLPIVGRPFAVCTNVGARLYGTVLHQRWNMIPWIPLSFLFALVLASHRPSAYL